jgi:hypothetical protein
MGLFRENLWRRKTGTTQELKEGEEETGEES